MYLKIRKINENAQVPKYATYKSAGLDLRAIQEYNIPAGKQILIKTGLAMKIPDGHAGLLCPRSGLALKDGITVLNSPGIIDADYCGDNDEVGVILYNTGSVHSEYNIKEGDRVAQLVIVPAFQAMIEEREHLEDKDRGGFGSTGKN